MSKLITMIRMAGVRSCAAAAAALLASGSLLAAPASPPAHAPLLAADARELGRSSAAAVLCGFSSDKDSARSSGFQLAADILHDGSPEAAQALLPAYAAGRAEFELEFRAASLPRIAELCSFSWIHWSSYESMELPEATFSGGPPQAAALARAAAAAQGALNACPSSKDSPAPSLGPQSAQALGLLALSTEGLEPLLAAHAAWLAGFSHGAELAGRQPLACASARAAVVELDSALGSVPDLPLLLRLSRFLRIRALGPWI